MRNYQSDSIQETLTKITKLTVYIRNDYPELYRTLEETPLHSTTNNSGGIQNREFQDYHNSLEELLSHYIKTRQGLDTVS